MRNGVVGVNCVYVVFDVSSFVCVWIYSILIIVSIVRKWDLVILVLCLICCLVYLVDVIVLGVEVFCCLLYMLGFV